MEVTFKMVEQAGHSQYTDEDAAFEQKLRRQAAERNRKGLLRFKDSPERTALKLRLSGALI